jgi:3-oxoacyl-[acyl-carrier protein] reductase
MSDLKGKVAVVTGASKGIGASIAKHLAAAGAAVVVNYATSKEGADRVVAEITAKGGKAVAVGGSVAKAAEIPGIIGAAKKEFGRLDILVNNAGVYEFGTLDAITEESFNRQFNTNVLGLLLTTQAAVKEFGAEGGNVINVSSIVARITPPGSSVYSGTKGAVDSITGVLAKELGSKKIRVNAVNPGLVETEGTQTAGFTEGAFADDYVKNAPLGRVGRPEDIARVVTFLASDESGWITGETLDASGGH